MRPVQAALARVELYDWVVCTSVNGVRYALGERTAPWPDSVKVAAIGPVTRDALEAAGVKVAYMPEEFRAERIADGVYGQRILLLRARGARPALRRLLQKRGACVDEVAAYCAETNVPPPAAYAAMHAGVDAVTFTSASTVKSYAELIGTDPQGVTVACIGPITACEAEERGFQVHVVAKEYTAKGLVDALKAFYEADE